MITGVSPRSLLAGALLLLLLMGAGTGSYFFYRSYESTKSELASTTAARMSLAEELAQARATNTALSERLAGELAKNGIFENQISDIASTVGTLTKLSQTDKELLQKYSRVYFLNENYVPSDLSEIEPDFTLEPSRHLEFHTKALPYLEQMLEDAKADGTPLLVLSSYRSFKEQASLKSSYTVTYGTGSNRFSADQGYSEHQLGTTVDLTTKALGTTSLAFGSTTAGVWLAQNAYRYGFILSYPKKNTYYQYEPWHWRFVGVALATRLHLDGVQFYDLPQRDIDAYLVNIFDTPPVH